MSRAKVGRGRNRFLDPSEKQSCGQGAIQWKLQLQGDMADVIVGLSKQGGGEEAIFQHFSSTI